LSKNIDFLIVGQGLAGSLLAWRLIQHNQCVVIVDHYNGSSSSLSAAGLVNPITGKRFRKDPSFETLLVSAKDQYQEFEDFFKTPFFFKKSLLRILISKQESTFWQKRETESDYNQYLEGNFDNQAASYDLCAPLGGYHQNFCGYLDTIRLLEKLKSFFSETKRFNKINFSHSKLVVKHQGFDWYGYNINKIIFCEGYSAINNPFFSWLPFQPSKGEILTLKMDQPIPTEIISRGKWLLPIGNGLCKVGSTYQRNLLNEKPSESAKIELLHSVKQMFHKPIVFKVHDHNAGIRPNTMDKKPFIGVHPRNPVISIFNGFGSKGVLTIPWYAEQFVDFLLQGTPLPADVDISRYCAHRFPG